jgi:hypothetical protein
MAAPFDRRAFLALAPAAVFLPREASRGEATDAPASSFPLQDRELVREVVAVSHGNLARVKELVTARPALARASWDWGFGDHEAAIDAASHVGNRPIAEFLIANGARPTIFTAAMMGQLQVVRGMIEAMPGVQRVRGPHGITLLAHARLGGAAAEGVLEFLQQLGDADPTYLDVPVPSTQDVSLSGEYAFDAAANGRYQVARNARGHLTLARPGVMVERRLFHQGDMAFIPAGAEAARIRFELTDAGAVRLTVTDGPVTVTARKVSPRAE